jgi:copper resistance protein B
MNTAGLAMIGTLLAWTIPQLSWSGAPASDAMSGMSGQPMSARMGMDDAAPIGKVMLNQFELEGGPEGTALTWDAEAWYGGDYDKVWLKTEGAPAPGNQDASLNELLWDHALMRWWDLQTGIRYDVGRGPARGWAAVGVAGLAPYWFDLEATLYVGEAGRTAARFQVEHDFLITQHLIVQPEVETNFYGKSDSAREVHSGLSDTQVGLRIRYEIRREFAPYLGFAWRRNLGAAASFAPGSSPGANSLQWVAGFRLWL